MEYIEDGVSSDDIFREGGIFTDFDVLGLCMLLPWTRHFPGYLFDGDETADATGDLKETWADVAKASESESLPIAKLIRGPAHCGLYHILDTDNLKLGAMSTVSLDKPSKNATRSQASQNASAEANASVELEILIWEQWEANKTSATQKRILVTHPVRRGLGGHLLHKVRMGPQSGVLALGVGGNERVETTSETLGP